MILLSALVLGLLAGLARARWQRQSYLAPDLRDIWLALVAFVPQLVIAYLPATRELLPGWAAEALLAASLVLFLAFVWVNRRLPGMPILFAGIALNGLVMLANGGWMPISPETARHLAGGATVGISDLGQRFGAKDVLLQTEDMRLPFLSDRFLLPDWSPYHVAFSLGDIILAIGVFWVLAGARTEGGEKRSET